MLLLARLQLNWKQWPLILFASVSIFSTVLMVAWSVFVRPVTWDNLSLYDSRSLQLTQNRTLADFRDQYSWDYTARGYDFIHPWGSSLVSALAYQVEGDYVSALVLPVLLSVLGLPLILWKSWPSRWVFWFFLTSSRLLFERSVEGYATWPNVLLWILGLGALFLWEQRKREAKWLLLASVFFAATQTLRTHEPFWLVLSLSWIVWQVLRTRSWKIPSLWQVLPWLVLGEWTWVRRSVFASFSGSFHPPASLVPEAASSLTVLVSSLLGLLWQQKDFWAFLIVLVFVARKRTVRNRPFFFFLAVLWLALMIGGAGYLVFTHPPSSALDFAQAWPRACLPLVALFLLLCADSLERPRPISSS